MSEKLNAETQGTVVPYLDSTTNFDQELAEVTNKREINRRSNNGITVVAYWLMQENVTLIYVHDARNNGSAEFEVPPDEVMEHFTHPFAHPGAFEVPTYRQGENNE